MNPFEFLCLLLFLALIHLNQMFYYRQARRELQAWPMAASRNISTYISTSTNKNLCPYSTQLLIIVHSKFNNEKARNAIRSTWGNKHTLKKLNTSLIFLLAQNRKRTVEEDTINEHLKYRDIIVENFLESYWNLTLKSVSMLKYAQASSKCKFLLKVDEDVFLNLPIMTKLLQSKMGKNLLIGRLLSNEWRKNDANRPWYAPDYMYMRRKYPPFLTGPAYLMSMDVARKLYKVALATPLFHLEDVFLTGICAKAANVVPSHCARFSDYGIPFQKTNAIKLVTLHSFDPEKMMSLYNLMKTMHYERVE